MTARTVVDVILGEAKAGDKEDMLAIASVIENRARALGVTPEQVVQVQSEFNAYGKPIPPGNDEYRDLAVAALEQVRTKGPVIDATFYATPKAKDNLPKGLQKVGATSGHVFYNDPKMRAIRTTEGFKQPSFDRIQVANETVTPRARPDLQSPAIETAFAPTGTVDQSPFDAVFGGTSTPAVPASPTVPAVDQPASIAQMMDVGNIGLNAPEMAFAPGNGLRGRAATVGAATNPFDALLGGDEELASLPAIDETLNYAYEGQTRRGMSPDHHSITKMQEDTVRDAGRVFDRMGINPQINSGYRSPDYNSLVDGVANSRHTMGDALDIDVTGMSMDDRVAMVDQLMSEGFTGIGGGKGSFIHVDQRPNSTSWGYSNNPLPAEIQEVVDARTAGGRLNQYPSDFGNIPAPRSRPTVAPDRPAGYVSASGLDSLALGELGADIGRDRRAGFGNGLALDNSMAAAMPAGPRATSFDIAAPTQAAASTRAPADYAIDYGPTPTTVIGLMEALGAPAQAAPSTRAPSFSQSRFDNTFDVVSTTPGVTSGYTAPRSAPRTAPGVSVASTGPVAPAAPVGGAMDLTKTTDLELPGLDGAARANMPTIDDGPVSMGGIGVPEMDPDTIYGRAGVFDKGRRTGLVVGGQLAGPIGAALGYTLGPSIGRRMGGKRYRGPAMGLSLPGFSGIGRMFGDNGYSTTPRGQAVAGYGRNFDANAAHRTYASLDGAQDAGSIARFEADMARERGQRNRTEGTSGGRSIGDALSEAFGGLF